MMLLKCFSELRHRNCHYWKYNCGYYNDLLFNLSSSVICFHSLWKVLYYIITKIIMVNLEIQPCWFGKKYLTLNNVDIIDAIYHTHFTCSYIHWFTYCSPTHKALAPRFWPSMDRSFFKMDGGKNGRFYMNW